MYEQDNYLRYYIKLALAYWRVIAASVLVAGIIALVLTMSQDHVYEAQSTVAMLRSRTEVELDPRIRTLSEQELMGNNAAAREEGLLALAKSNEVLLRVLEAVSDQLKPDNRELSTLREMAEANATGDLINITVRHPDPEVAASIANSWARIYEEYVNNVYNTSLVATEGNAAAQVEEAKENYQAAQAEFEAFIADDRILTLEREIEVREALLEGYKQTLIDMRVKPITTDQAILDSYYTELAQIDGWLADARSLLEQVQNGPDSQTSNLSNALALVLLRSKVVSSSGNARSSVNAQTADSESGTSGVYVSSDNSNAMNLQIDIGAALAEAEGVSPGDVTSLIDTLQTRREATDERIAALQEKLNSSAATSDVSAAKYSQLEGEITAIEEEITDLQRDVEAQTALRQELEQARDRSWETYQVLLGRQSEQDITTGSPAAEVRIADLAVVPAEPISRGVIRNTLLAGTVAFMFSVGVILLIDWWTWGERPSATADQEREVQSATGDQLGVERVAEGSPGSRKLSNRTT